jgi:hypothetical protein
MAFITLQYLIDKTLCIRLLGAHALCLQMPPSVTAELHKEEDIVSALENFGKKGICDVSDM